MTVDDSKIGPWSREKLGILADYLRAYSVIMNAQRGKGWLCSYSYIDAFACTGRSVDRETQAYVDGSPFVALKCVPPFNEFWFIELSKRRLEKLERRVRDEYPSCLAHFRQGDANAILRDQVIPAFAPDSRQRAFIFLDPYGLQIEFDTVRRLSETGVFDIFINFSTMGITRLCPRGGVPDRTATDLISRVMGDSHWIHDMYEKRVDLFGEERASRGRLDPILVSTRYVEKLRDLFPYVSNPVEMCNSQGATLYVLLLASRNRKAVEITNDITERHRQPRPEQPRLL